MDRAAVDGVLASIDAEVEWAGKDGMRWRPPDVWDDNPPIPWLTVSPLALHSRERDAAVVAAREGMDGWAATQWSDWVWRLTLAMRPVVEAYVQLANSWSSVSVKVAGFVAAFERYPGAPLDPRERALWLRRHRNTGPADQRGLDGHHRRNTT